MEKHRYGLQIKLVEFENALCQPSDSVYSRVVSHHDGVQHAINSDYAAFQGKNTFRFANSETIVQVDPCSCQNMTPAQLKNLFPSTSPITLHDVLSNQRLDDPLISNLVRTPQFVSVEIRRSNSSVLLNSSSHSSATSSLNVSDQSEDQLVGTLFLSTHDRAGLQVHHLYNQYNHYTGRVVLLWFPMLPQLLVSLPTYQQPEKKFFSFAQDETSKKYSQRRALLDQFLKLLFKPTFSEQSDVYQQFYEELSGVAKELQDVDFRAMFFEQLTPIAYQSIKDIASGGNLTAVTSSKDSAASSRAQEAIGNKIGIDANPPYLTHPSITAIFLIFLNMCLNFSNQSRDFTSVYHILQLSSNFSYSATVLSAIKNASSVLSTSNPRSNLKLHTTFLCSAYSIIKEHALVKSQHLWNFVYIEAVKLLDAMYAQHALSTTSQTSASSLLNPSTAPGSTAASGNLNNLHQMDDQVQLFKHKFWSRRLAHISTVTLQQQRQSVPSINMKKEEYNKSHSDVCPYHRLYLQFEAKYSAARISIGTNQPNKNASVSQVTSFTPIITPVTTTTTTTTTSMSRTSSTASMHQYDHTISFSGDDLNSEKPSYLQMLQYRIAHHYSTIHGTNPTSTTPITSTTTTISTTAPTSIIATPTKTSRTNHLSTTLPSRSSHSASSSDDETYNFRQQYENILHLSAKDRDFFLLIQLIICQLLSIGEDTQQIIAFILGLNLDKKFLRIIVSWWDTQQLIIENFLPERALYKELTQSSDINWAHCRSTFDLPPRMEPSSELYPSSQRYSSGDFWVQQNSTTITGLLASQNGQNGVNTTSSTSDTIATSSASNRAAAGKLDWGKEPKRPLPIHVSLVPPPDWTYYNDYKNACNSAKLAQGTTALNYNDQLGFNTVTEQGPLTSLSEESNLTLSPSIQKHHTNTDSSFVNNLSVGDAVIAATPVSTSIAGIAGIASVPMPYETDSPRHSVSSDDYPSSFGSTSEGMDFSDEDDDDFGITAEELALFRSASGIGDEVAPILPDSTPPDMIPPSSSSDNEEEDEDYFDEDDEYTPTPSHAGHNGSVNDTPASSTISDASDGASGFGIQPTNRVKNSFSDLDSPNRSLNQSNTAHINTNTTANRRPGRNAEISDSDEDLDDFIDVDDISGLPKLSNNIIPSTPTRPKSYSITPSISRNNPPPVPLRAPSISRNGSGYTPVPLTTTPITLTLHPLSPILLNPIVGSYVAPTIPLTQPTPGIISLNLGFKNNKKISSVAYDPVFTSIAMRRHRESVDFFTDDLLAPLTTLGLPEVGELAQDNSYSSMLPGGHTMHRRNALQMSSRPNNDPSNNASKRTPNNGNSGNNGGNNNNNVNNDVSMQGGTSGWTRIPFDYMHGETALLTLDVFCLDMPSLLHYATRARRQLVLQNQNEHILSSTNTNPLYSSPVSASQMIQLSQSYSTSLNSQPMLPNTNATPSTQTGGSNPTNFAASHRISVNPSDPNTSFTSSNSYQTLPSLLLHTPQSTNQQSTSFAPIPVSSNQVSTPMSTSTLTNSTLAMSNPSHQNSLTNHQPETSNAAVSQTGSRPNAGQGAVQWFPRIPLHSVDNVNVSFSVGPGQALPGGVNGVSYPHDAMMPKSMSQTQDHPHIEPDLEITVSNLQRVLDDAVSRGKLTLTNYRLIYSPYVYMSHPSQNCQNVASNASQSSTSFSLNGTLGDSFHNGHNGLPGTTNGGTDKTNPNNQFLNWADPPAQSAYCAEPNCSRCIEQRCRRVFGTIPLQCIHRLEQVDATDAKAKSFQMSILDEFKKIDQSKHLSQLSEQQQIALSRNVSQVGPKSGHKLNTTSDDISPLDRPDGVPVALTGRNPASPSLNNPTGKPGSSTPEFHSSTQMTTPSDLSDPNFGDTPLTSDILFRLITAWCMGSARHIDLSNTPDADSTSDQHQHTHTTHPHKEEVLLHIRCKDSRQATFCIKHSQFGKSPQQLWGHFCRQLQSAAYGKAWNSIADAGPRYPPHVNEVAYRINSIAPDRLKYFSQFFQLYAFILTSNKKHRESNGWDVYNPRVEYERQGCLTSGDFMEFDNSDYKLCQTYPSTLYFQWRTKHRGNTAQANLPISPRETDEMVSTILPKAAKYRSKGRIPTVSFYHATTGGTLLRSAQPLSGITNGRSSHDEELCNRAAISIIFDARPKQNAQANKMKGGGFEPKPDKYNSTLIFCDIENIHKMRTALKEITTICREACPHVLITNSTDAGIIHSTMIFQHAARILATSEAHQRALLLQQAQQQQILIQHQQQLQLIAQVQQPIVLTSPTLTPDSTSTTPNPIVPPRRPAPLPGNNLAVNVPNYDNNTTRNYQNSNSGRHSTTEHEDTISRNDSSSKIQQHGGVQPPSRRDNRRGSFASSVTVSNSHLHSYTGVRSQFAGQGQLYIPSATDLIARCGVKTLPERYGQLVESEWAQHVTGLLGISRQIAQHLLDGKSCLARCSDGWDRTSQMCALASIMVDPYYRTIEGFAVIIEKEFLSFGHKFSDRCGHASNNHGDVERSPIFIQFLDAVYQLLVQNPQAFEFDDSLLHYIATHTYSCKYGTFLFNSHRERNHIVQVQLLTVSIWDVVICKHKNKFVNPHYEPHLSHPLQKVFPSAPAKLGDKCDQSLIDLAEQSALLWIDAPWSPWNFYFRWDLRTVYEYKI